MKAATLLIPSREREEPARRTLAARPDPRICDVCDLARESDHRIANHLAMLSGYVRLKANEMAEQITAPSVASIQLALNSICSQIEAVSALHRALSTRNDAAALDLSESLHQICRPFLSGLSGAITLTEDLRPGCLVRNDQVLPLTQIVSEVITNAVKYSHASGEPGQVRVSCRRTSDQQLDIEISDDGNGLPDLLDPAAAGGLGFRLIRALTAQIGARSGFESSPSGTRFWLTIASCSAKPSSRRLAARDGRIL